MKRTYCAESLQALALAQAAASCASPRARDVDPAGSTHALAALLAEGRALGGLLAPTSLLFAATLLALAFGLDTLIHASVKFAWRLGFDGGRRWARASGLLRLLVVALAALALLRGIFAAAPVLTSGLVLSLVLGAFFRSGLLPNAFAGIGLALRRRIRVGDRVKIGAHEGVVREVSLFQLYLRAADGAALVVPNRLLNEVPVVVERARNSVPVRVRVKVDREPDARLLERLRQIATLSPYRAPESPIDISRSDEDERLLTVEIQAWSARAHRDARAQLESALRRALG